jgi:hypothetical protein
VIFCTPFVEDIKKLENHGWVLYVLSQSEDDGPILPVAPQVLRTR